MTPGNLVFSSRRARRSAALTAIALSAASSLALAGYQETSTQGSQQSGQPEWAQEAQPSQGIQAAQSETAQLVAADELVGRQVTTQEGEQVGRLEFVTIALEQGAISHLLVDTSGTRFAEGGDSSGAAAGTTGAQGELMVVPWHAARVDSQSQQIVVLTTGEQLAGAPRIQREQLAQLTEPAMASYVVEYWAPVSEMAALEEQRQQQQQQQQQQQPGQQPMQDQQRTQQQDQQRMQERMRDPQMHDPSRMQSRMQEQKRMHDPAQMRQQMPGSAQGAQQQMQAQQRQPGQAQAPGQQQRQQQQQQQRQMVLVGQELVAAVAPPMFQVSKQLRGATVNDQSGNRLGEIRQIMIDPATGAAAYAIVEGTPVGRAPVPVQALQWTAQETTRLDADTSLLESNTALTENPGQVERQQLAQLYQRFDVRPYWDTQGQ